MAEQAIGKYSVDVTKKDGMKSTCWQVDCCGFARVGA
jgi:hypothetical protein